jgi:hypothetical protein
MRYLAPALSLIFALTIGAAHAQFGPAVYVAQSAGGGGGAAGPFVLKAHAALTGGSPDTANVDCTGANFLVVVQTRFPSGANAAPSDTGSNTYTQVGTEATNGTSNVAIWVSMGSPSVSASFHWGNNIGSQFGTLQGACFSDGSTSSTDAHNQADNANQPGSVTPSVNSELVVTGYVPPNGGSGTPTISAGFTITDAAAYASGSTVGGAMAYQIQTTATPVNPTWATTGGGTGAAIIETFK